MAQRGTIFVKSLVDMESRTPKIDSLFYCFYQCVKFRVGVSIGLRVRVWLVFTVRIRVRFRVKVSSICNIY